MNIRSLCAIALTAIMVFIAGNASAHHTLNAKVIEEILEQPIMLENIELSLESAVQADQVEVMIEQVFEPLEIVVPGIVDKMIDIADCESNLNHLWPRGHPQAGALKENPDPKSSASGALQVLLITHRPDYQRLGLDPRNVADNILFSRYMVERKIRQGRRNVFEDWVCA